mgnify:FL=1|jgi:hypothetical protein
MARINSYTKITGAPADSDCFIIDSTQGTAGTRIVLWSVLKSVLTGIFAPKSHKHPGSDITSAVANANAATNDSVGQNIASTYVKSVTASGRTVTVTKGNGTASTFTTQDTTYGNMGGATTSAAGKAGLVPAPATGENNRYLRSDGTWAVPPDNNTTYSVATQSVNGLMSAADKKKLDGLSSNVTGAIGLATPSKDGLMSKGDKAKLDAIGSISNNTIDGFFRI